MKGLVVHPRAMRPMRQETADRDDEMILKPDFRTAHPQPRIDPLNAGFSPESDASSRGNIQPPPPSPKPSQTGKADSCFLFWHGEGGQKGEPWFVAADVCRALGLGNSSMAVSKLDEDEKGISSIDTLGGEQKLGIVNEPGLYTLVLSSRKPEAKAFKRWITHEQAYRRRKRL